MFCHVVSAVAQPHGLFVIWSARSHSSHSVNNKQDLELLKLSSERETEKIVDDKDAENTEKSAKVYTVEVFQEYLKEKKASKPE